MFPLVKAFAIGMIFCFSAKADFLQKKEIDLNQKLPEPTDKITGALWDLKMKALAGDYRSCVNGLDEVRKKEELQPWILANTVDCYNKMNEKDLFQTAFSKIKNISEDTKKYSNHFESNKIKNKFLSILEKIFSQVESNNSNFKDWLEMGEGWFYQMPDELKSHYYYMLGLEAEKSNNAEAAFQYFRQSSLVFSNSRATQKLEKFSKFILPPSPDSLTLFPQFSVEETELMQKWKVAVQAGKTRDILSLGKTFLQNHAQSIQSQEVFNKLLLMFNNAYFGSADRSEVESQLSELPAVFAKSLCEKLFSKAKYKESIPYCQKASENAAVSSSRMQLAKSLLYTNDLVGSQKVLKKIALEFGGTEEYIEANFILAVTFLKQKKYEEALKIFDQHVKSSSMGDFDYRYRYWQWRTLLKLNNDRHKLAGEEFMRLYPYSYYGLLVRVKTKGNLKDLFKADDEKNNQKINIWLTPSMQKQFQKIELLVQNGWWNEAQSELEKLPVSSQNSDNKLRAYLWRKTLSLYKAIPEINTAMYYEPNQTLSYIKLVFPDWYQAEIKKSAEEQQLSQMFLQAIIRQESSFDKDVVSSAGAIGLMQVMPQTGEESLKKSLGNKKVQDALREPQVNVKVGSAYVKRLIKKYNNFVPLSIAAYNVGPGRLDQWLKSRGETPEIQDLQGFEDLWIDEMPWTETSFYVKAVLRNYFLYSHLFEGLVELPSPGWRGVLKYDF